MIYDNYNKYTYIKKFLTSRVSIKKQRLSSCNDNELLQKSTSFCGPFLWSAMADFRWAYLKKSYARIMS